MSRRPTPKVRDDATVADAYVALRSSLLAYLRRHVDDAQAAEDLLQDVVLKALLARSDEAPRNLGAWLYGIARNAAIDHHRRRRPLEPMTDELIEGLAADGPDEAVIAREALANCLRPMIGEEGVDREAPLAGSGAVLSGRRGRARHGGAPPLPP